MATSVSSRFNAGFGLFVVAVFVMFAVSLFVEHQQLTAYER